MRSLGGRGQPAVEVVEQRPVDPGGRVDQPARIDQVPGALLVDVDGGAREGGGDVADPSGVVQVNVGDGHARPALPAATPWSSSAFSRAGTELWLPVSMSTGAGPRSGSRP